MRVVLAALPVITAIVLAAGAHGDAGLPSPGIATGWTGVRAPAGTIRYVAFPGRRETIVAKVRVHGGRVVHWGVLPRWVSECLSSPTTARLAACPRTAAGSS